MQAATLEVLEKANVPAPQARALARAIEIELAAHRDTLATKLDITELRLELKSDIQHLRTELKGDMQELRVELKGDMHGIRSELVRWVFLVMMG
ncbi:MAG TPA: hypothetical protein VJ011_01005, partial [Steroidobacteraceae bacterium]|nr:hypothetical protein [Steroidobacteraceae bacterium]